MEPVFSQFPSFKEEKDYADPFRNETTMKFYNFTVKTGQCMLASKVD